MDRDSFMDYVHTALGGKFGVDRVGELVINSGGLRTMESGFTHLAGTIYASVWGLPPGDLYWGVTRPLVVPPDLKSVKELVDLKPPELIGYVRVSEAPDSMYGIETINFDTVSAISGKAPETIAAGQRLEEAITCLLNQRLTLRIR